MFDEKVHGAKQVVVVNLAAINACKVDSFHPFEDMEFGHGIKESVGNKDLEVCNQIEIESASFEVFFYDISPAKLLPDTKNCKCCPEILAEFGCYGLRSMVFNFKEPPKGIDHPFNLLPGVLVSRPEVDDDVLADLSLSGPNTFDQVKRLVSLVATFSGSCSEIHDATI